MQYSNGPNTTLQTWRQWFCVSLLAFQLGCSDATSTPTRIDLVNVKTTSKNLSEIPSRPVESAAAESAPAYYATPRIENSIVIGLDADMTSGSARSGEAIRRGLELAIHEINLQGGLLDRPVELIVRDHRGNPDRGLGNLEAFSTVNDLLGVFGGIHTPVAIRELEFIHKNRMLYFCPWAAGTPIVQNGYSPNHVFRVSVRDEYAGGFLVHQSIQRGAKRIALMLEQTAWGRSNEVAMKAAFENQTLSPAAIEWFNWGDRDLLPQVKRLAALRCDTILFVGNSLEGVALAKAVASLPTDERPIIVSHWGISGGEFFQQASEYLPKVDVSFLQTFSFIQPKHPERDDELERAYISRYPDCDDARGIFAPVGTAHAYELMRMVAAAVKHAKSIDHLKVISSLEDLHDYRGVIRDYEHPFPKDHHDALDAEDFILARFDDQGTIVPARLFRHVSGNGK